jgi:hypothetical protein
MAIATVLSDRRSILVFALLGMLLNVLGLFAPPITDDFLQWAILTKSIEHTHQSGSLFGLFDLVTGTPENVQSMKASGRLLWSASEDLHLAFWRPLAELSHWLDYTLWPSSPALMRAHNLLWFGALVLLLGKFYRMLDRTPIQSHLATGIFAISSLHFFVIMWISARNQLMAACFCVLTLIAHHQWRAGQGRRHAVLACLSLALGLMCAEAALATAGYLFAYALIRDDTPSWRQRLLSLAPYFVLVITWRLMHVQLGFGSHASGSYIDPGLNARFLQALLHRLPALLFGEISGAGAGFTQGMSDTALTAYALITSALLIGLILLARRWRLWGDRTACFYAVGAVLALVPVCAINPTERVLLNSEIGMSGVLAAVFCRAFAPNRTPRDWLDRGAKWVAGAFVVVHMGLFPLATLVMPVVTDKTFASLSMAEALSLPSEQASPDAQFVVINPPVPFSLYYYPLVRSYFGQPNPGSIRALATGNNQALRLTVLDSRRLELSSDTAFSQAIMRDLVTRPFKVGDTTRMGDVDVLIKEVGKDGGPRRIQFTFATELKDQRLHFFLWDFPSYKRYELPPIGQTVAIAPTDLKAALKQSLQQAYKRDTQANAQPLAKPPVAPLTQPSKVKG